MLLLHVDEAGEQGPHGLVVGRLGGFPVEGLAAELDFEGDADGFEGLGIGDFTLTDALRACRRNAGRHAVREGEAFADLAAVLAPPTQFLVSPQQM